MRRHYGEPLECRGLQKALDALHGVSMHGEDEEITTRHHVRRALRKVVLPLVVQVRVPLELDELDVDRRPPKRVRHPLGHHHPYHHRKHVLIPAGDLEHDHDETDSHPRDAAEHGRCPHDRVDPRGDTRRGTLADVKHANVPHLVLEELQSEANSASEECANDQRGHEDPTWARVSGGHDGEEDADDCREHEEREDVAPVFVVAELLVHRGVAVLALREERLEQEH
mmetsp:Transcript_12428/g.30104  ORF Transcript_12428/g.30104 Transcript_12428/m.30104 type:complete len:226 (+) Transcript_12428:446-1123(+)